MLKRAPSLKRTTQTHVFQRPGRSRTTGTKPQAFGSMRQSMPMATSVHAHGLPQMVWKAHVPLLQRPASCFRGGGGGEGRGESSLFFLFFCSRGGFFSFCFFSLGGGGGEEGTFNSVSKSKPISIKMVKQLKTMLQEFEDGYPHTFMAGVVPC